MVPPPLHKRPHPSTFPPASSAERSCRQLWFCFSPLPTPNTHTHTVTVTEWRVGAREAVLEEGRKADPRGDDTSLP